MTDDLDVAVAGAGMAGTVAAIAAARNGARVALTDRATYLGGNATGGLLGNFLTFHNMRGEQICDGVPQEIVDRCIALGGAFPQHRGHLPNAYGNAYSVTPIDAEVLKLVVQQMCVEAGVQLRLGAFTTGPLVSPEGRVEGIKLVDKSGEHEVRSKVVIDATGDGDLVAKGGGAFQLGDDKGQTMSMTQIFRLGGVDLDRHLAHVKQHPDQFMLAEDPYLGLSREEAAARLQTWQDYPLITGYYDAVKAAKAKGEFHPNRERIVFSITTTPGVVTINATSILGENAVDAASLTRASLQAREQVHAVAAFFQKYAPGFENSYVLDSAAMLGIRESRRIVGVKTLTDDDCVAGAKHDDDIGRGAYTLDVHEPSGKIVHKHVEDGESYGIPYGCLVPEQLDGLLVAGRCLSSERYANGSARNQAHIQAMGQAAGTAAALCAQQNQQPRDVDVAQLRGVLTDQGAVV
ncbi:MAG: FAD-dependent oxidoreductase [Micromonosporaceae bacterium]